MQEAPGLSVKYAEENNIYNSAQNYYLLHSIWKL